MTTAELDDILIAQFRNEAKRFNPDFIPNIVPDLNSPEAMAAIQDYGPFYGFKSKAVILADFFNPDSAESKNAASMKEYFKKYIEEHPTMDDVMMVDLYSSGDLRAVAHTIGLLATGFLLSELEDVSTMTEEFQKKVLDPEAVGVVILSLIYFTILVNSIIGTDVINKIFIGSWENFYSLYLKRVEWLCEYGKKWKNEFSGVLFFD